MSNILTYSEDFSNIYWRIVSDPSKPILTTSQIDPQGGSTATLVQDNSGSLVQSLFHSPITVTAGQTHTLSLFIKKDATPTVYPGILFGYTSNWRGIVIDPSDGSFVEMSFASGSTGNTEDYNTDYWRISVSGLAPAATTAVYLYPAYNADATSVSAIAAQGSTVFWGAQFELGTTTGPYDVKPLTNDTSDIAVDNLPLATFATTSTILCTPDEILFYCNESRIYTNLADITCDDISYPSNLLDIQICLPPGDLPLVSYITTSISDDISLVALGNLTLTAQVPDVLLDDTSDIATDNLVLYANQFYIKVDDVTNLPLANLPLTKYDTVSLITELTQLPLGNLPLSSQIPTAIGDDVSAVNIGNLPLTAQPFEIISDDVTNIALNSLPLVGYNFKSLENDITWIPLANLPFTPLRIISTLDANVVCTIGGYADIIRDDKPVKLIDPRLNKVVILKNNPVVVVQDLDPIVVAQDPLGKIVQKDFVILTKIYDGEDEQEIMYTKRVDFIDENLLYRGEAEPGIFTTQGFWRIRKISISAIDDDIVEIWADGNDNFDKIWDDHLSYQYI